MKKSEKLLFTIGFSIALWLIATFSFAASQGTITGETVKLREEASLEGKLVTLLSVGNKVEVLGKEGQWYQVTYKDKKGYVFEDYIKVEGELEKNNSEETTPQTKPEEVAKKPEENKEEEPKKEESQEEKQEQVSYPREVKLKKNTKIYLLPVINADSIITSEKEKTVTATEELNDWIYVAGEEFSGWIRKNSLEQKETENNSEPEENKKEEPEKEDDKRVGYIKSATVNLRKEPSTSSEILDSLPQNTEVTILGEKDNWYHVRIKGKTGYIAVTLISDEKVTTSRNASAREEKTSKTMYVAVGTANIREKASTSSKLLGKVYRKDSITVTGEDGKFYQVIVEGKEGYIAKELLVATIEEVKKATTNTTSSNKEAASSNTNASNEQEATKASEIVAYAKTFLGVPYQYGASGPKAFDCSGFTSYVYRHFGYALSRSSSGQSKNGRAVSKAELQPGDLVIFGSKGSVNHVGIYIGNNQFIHAESPGKDVTITSLSASYYASRYMAARRIIE